MTRGGPFGGYATVDHPTGGADLQVRTTSSGQVGGTDRVMFKFTVLAGSPGNVRIGVATDGLDGAFFSPASIGLRQVGGGGSSAEHTLTAVNNTLDMIFFDVRGVQAGDQFEIFGDTGAGGFATHQFVTWDALPIVVTTTADDNNGATNGTSLREALAAAANAPGPDLITFAPALSGQTINLTTTSNIGSGNTALVIADAGGVTVDASALPGGITLSGAGAAGTYRLIQLTSGSLTLANGGGGGFGSYGGGIANNGGALTLDRCTLVGNRVGGGPFGGGAILNNGGALSLTCTHCTFSGNDFTGTADPGSSGGGAINHRASTPATFTHCTFFGNTTNQSGGAILATTGMGTSIMLTNTIVAGNTAGAGGPDVWTGGATPTTSGKNLIGNLTDSGLTAGATVIVNAAPHLAGLAYYSGGTATLPPLVGSPAIDPSGGDSTSTFNTDQRGQPRVVGGIVDIGAVEYSATASALSAVVVNNADSGLGSLRGTLAAVPTGSTITFDPAVFTGATATTNTISLTGPVNDSAFSIDKAVTIAATAIPGGVKLDANSQDFQFFYVNPGASLTLHDLTLANGGGTDSEAHGGAIHNDGTLSLSRCTLSGNSTRGNGGAIWNLGTLTLTQCTLTGNTSTDGFGGGIYSQSGLTTLTHCTLSGNTAPADKGSGVASFGNASVATRVQNCIISGNTNSSVDVVAGATNTFTSLGGNLIGTGNTTALAAFTAIGDILNNAPQLAPLGNYGGPTPTMPPMAGSPAIDATSATTITDQRGFSAQDGDANGSVLADIGAAEAQVMLVTTATDENNGTTAPGSGTGTSLREVIADTSGHADIIRFDPAVFDGQPADIIRLTVASDVRQQITIARSLSVDARDLPSGLTISGDSDSSGTPTNGDTRIFRVNFGQTVALHGLTLKDGNVSGVGGGIYNTGTLTVTQSTLSGNSTASPIGQGGARHRHARATRHYLRLRWRRREQHE